MARGRSEKHRARGAGGHGLILGVFVAACSAGAAGRGRTAPPEDNEDAAAAERMHKGARIDQTRCATTAGKTRTEQADVNHDGRSDLVTVYDGPDGENLACKQADLNFDGRLDAYFHYDSKGEILREQFDQDFDGQIDMGRTYDHGVLQLDEQDLNRDGFVDTWRRYEKGHLLRIETDRDGDGKPDMFAHYVGGHLDRVGYDVNGDGRVDQWDHDAARRARLAESARNSHTASDNRSSDTQYVETPPETAAAKTSGSTPEPASTAPPTAKRPKSDRKATPASPTSPQRPKSATQRR